MADKSVGEIWEDLGMPTTRELHARLKDTEHWKLTWSQVVHALRAHCDPLGVEAYRSVRMNKILAAQSAPAEVERHERRRTASPRQPLNAAVVDIETTSFEAPGYEGILVCMCILPLVGDEVFTYS